jgi:hypothetical protein
VILDTGLSNSKLDRQIYVVVKNRLMLKSTAGDLLEITAELKNIWLCPGLTSWSSALLEKPPVLPLLKNFRNFMEPEGSLPCSQEPSTCPYLEPD